MTPKYTQLLRCYIHVGRIDLSESFESGLGPDTEPSEVTARGQMEEIHSAHVQEGDSWEIPESFGDSVVFFVDHERSFPHGVTPVPDLADTGPDL